MEILTKEWAQHVYDICMPLYSNNNITFGELLCYDMDETKRIAVYSKISSMFYAKVLSEVYGKNYSYANNIRVENNLLYVNDCADKEYYASELYNIENNYTSPKRGPFWDDHFLIDSSECPDIVDTLSFYLNNLSYIEEKAPDDFFPETLDDYRRECKYSSAVESIRSWFKDEYSDEMAFALLPHMDSVFNSLCCGESYMNIIIYVNIAIKPFLDWFRRNKALRKDKTVQLILRMVQSMTIPSDYYYNDIADIIHGETKSLFYNTISLGTCYEESLLSVELSMLSNLAYIICDDLIAYLDNTYHFLPEKVRQVYNEANMKQF